MRLLSSHEGPRHPFARHLCAAETVALQPMRSLVRRWTNRSGRATSPLHLPTDFGHQPGSHDREKFKVTEVHHHHDHVHFNPGELRRIIVDDDTAVLVHANDRRTDAQIRDALDRS